MVDTVVPLARRSRVFRSGRTIAARLNPVPGQECETAPDRPWWSRLVDEETYRQITVEIERTKGHISAHERECAIRYQGIKDTMADMKASIDLLLTKERGHERRLSSLQIATLVFVIGTMLTLMGWMAMQLYHLEPLRQSVAEQSR